jgi:tetratricopeptide (TPR) repeat protein
MNQLAIDDLQRLMEVIRKAVEFDENGDSAFALQVLSAVVEEFPGLALGHSYLAWVLSRVGRHREAIEHGRVAIQLSPESERVSILLFRVLWSAGESTQALDEMKRFMAIGHSDEYLSVMNELEQTGE